MIKPTFEPTPGTIEAPRVIITPDSQAFDKFLPVSTDSLGGTSFKEFIKYAPANFLPRWSTYEEISNTRLDTPKIIREYGRDTTAIILNSGGAHSLAMACELARDGGWQPVPMPGGVDNGYLFKLTDRACMFHACSTCVFHIRCGISFKPTSDVGSKGCGF